VAQTGLGAQEAQEAQAEPAAAALVQEAGSDVQVVVLLEVEFG
jgi:hypothetical protein